MISLFIRGSPFGFCFAKLNHTKREPLCHVFCFSPYRAIAWLPLQWVNGFATLRQLKRMKFFHSFPQTFYSYKKLATSKTELAENFVLILFLYHKENLADEKSFKASALVHTGYNSLLLFSVRSLGMYTRRFATSIILSTTSAWFSSFPYLHRTLFLQRHFICIDQNIYK